MPFPLLAGAAAGTVGAVLGRILAWVAAGLIFRLIAAFGIGVVVFFGVGELMDSALAQVQALSAGLPTTVAQAFRLMKVDDAISVIFGAISIRLSLKTFGPAGGIGAILARGGSTP